jgi:hypothetical protein
MSKLSSTFDEAKPSNAIRHSEPYLGRCEHTWGPPNERGRQRCTACRATCARDEDGLISDFSAS